MQDKIDWIALSLLRCWGHMWAHCWAMATHVINDWITLTHRVNSLKRDCVIWRCAFAGQAAEDGSLEKILQAKSKKQAGNRFILLCSCEHQAMSSQCFVTTLVARVIFWSGAIRRTSQEGSWLVDTGLERPSGSSRVSSEQLALGKTNYKSRVSHSPSLIVLIDQVWRACRIQILLDKPLYPAKRDRLT